MFIGTFDAILGEQDGLPTCSPNGVSVFLKDEHAARFVSAMGKPKLGIVVPDTTSSELLATYRMVDMINYRTAFLPFDIAAKDYTEYRLQGGTVKSFMGDVLGIDSPFVSDDRAEQVRSLLTHMSKGNTYDAISSMQDLYRVPVHPMVLNHTMQLYIYQAARFFPTPEFYKGFSGEEWQQIVLQLEESMAGPRDAYVLYTNMVQVITKWSELAYLKQGGF